MTTTGDARLVERLLTNLLDNAIRHNRPGGRVDISTRADGNSATLVVSNTGPEVSSADIEGFLKPFRRGTTDRTARGQGLGLGLPIVQAVAATHSAQFTLGPRRGGGIDAQVVFPASTTKGHRPLQDLRPPAASRRPRRQQGRAS